MVLKLPEGAEAAFRIVETDAFDGWFAINVYGAGRDGWFVATNRGYRGELETGLRPLPKGEWRTVLDLIGRCGFWVLPEGDDHLVEPNVTVDDGSFLTITGRKADRFHRIHRFVWREPGLDALLRFGWRVSGLLARDPVRGWWVPPSELTPPGPAPKPDNPGAV